jgi:hypothetical protein
MKEYDKLTELLKNKASVKQDVFHHGKDAFSEFKNTAKSFITQLAKSYNKIDSRVKINFEDISDQEFRLIIGGDILLFHMHTNVFQYDKSHYYWQQGYFKKDPSRSYGIMIRVYNFLSESFLLDRENDLGYLIGRIFINKENNFTLESKLKLNSRFPYLNRQSFTEDLQKQIINCLLVYSMEFELNIPSFTQVQTVSVRQAKDFKYKSKLVTAKRLGFQFANSDTNEFD